MLLLLKTSPKCFEKVAEEGGHFPKQVFNVAETKLLCKGMLLQMYIFQKDKSSLRFKASNDQLTLLLVGSTERGYKNCHWRTLVAVSYSFPQT
jgi:hypothetical protein